MATQQLSATIPATASCSVDARRRRILSADVLLSTSCTAGMSSKLSLSATMNPKIGVEARMPMATASPALNKTQSLTLPAGATTFAATGKLVLLSGDVGTNTIATITGPMAFASNEITIIFQDADVTFTNDDTSAANTLNLDATFTSAANDVLKLIYDGNKWFMISMTGT